jgi:hypothetical protein
VRPTCTQIPELKKLNNIQNDAEVQARQSVKVPIAKYGIFSEQVENLVWRQRL